jgi:CarboxypepD_reg-like domain/Carboxypeptidase regulatory-like domain/Secretion system C-terminal sorting domain
MFDSLQQKITMKKITLSIPEPCHEDWNKMTPSQQGRFCGSCQKDVIDFTAMTDDELFRFFAEKKSTNVCGRTLAYQLNTPIAKPVEHKKRKFWYISYLTSLLLFFSKSETKAQTKTPVSVSPTAKPTVLGRMTRLPVTAEQKAGFVTGKVIDQSGNPVPYASVDIKGGIRAVSADMEGNYKVKAKAGDILTVSAAGFESKTIHLTISLTQNVTLSRTERIIQGEMIVVAGGISASSSDDYVAPDQSLHIAQLYVKEDGSNAPVANAQLNIVRNNQNKQKKRYTSSQGFYELRNIKESDSYEVTVSAIGYKDQTVVINGDDFSNRKMEKIILLEKIESPKQVLSVPEQITPVQNNVNIKYALQGRAGGIVVVAEPAAQSSLKQNLFSQLLIKPIKKLLSPAGTKTAKTKALLSVYPNPVSRGGSITLTIRDFFAGNYTLSIVNTAGEQVYSIPVNLTENRSSLTVNTAHVKIPGIYVIEMISESGNKTACKLLVQ